MAPDRSRREIKHRLEVPFGKELICFYVD